MRPLLLIAVGGLLVSLTWVSARAQSRDISEDPKYLRLVDLAKCDLQVGEIERIDKAQLPDGSVLTPSRRDAQLVLIQLKGTAAEDGRLSMNPRLFGVNFIWRGFLKLSLAKGLCFRGKTPEGKPVEVWHHNEEDSLNLVRSEGDTVNFWIAVEIPKDAKEVFVRFPAAIDDAAQIPTPSGGQGHQPPR